MEAEIAPSRTCSLYVSAFTRLTSSEGGKRDAEPGKSGPPSVGGGRGREGEGEGGVSELTVEKEISDVLRRRLEAEWGSDFYGAAIVLIWSTFTEPLCNVAGDTPYICMECSGTARQRVNICLSKKKREKKE